MRIKIPFLLIVFRFALFAFAAPAKNEARAGSYVNGMKVELENKLRECANVFINWSEGDDIGESPYTLSIGRSRNGTDRSIDWFFTKSDIWSPNDDWKVTEVAGTELRFQVVDANNMTAYLPNQKVRASKNHHFVQDGKCVYVHSSTTHKSTTHKSTTHKSTAHHSTTGSEATKTAKETTSIPTDALYEATTSTQTSEAETATPTETAYVCERRA